MLPVLFALVALSGLANVAHGQALTTFTATAANATQGTFSTSATRLANLSNLAGSGNTYNYIAVQFTASATRTYTFGQTEAPVDTIMILYSGTFNPASPSTNALVLNDDMSVAAHAAVGATVTGSGCGSVTYCPQVSRALTSGETVTLVISTYNTGAPLGYPQAFYSDGPGTFSVYSEPAPANVPVLSPAMLLFFASMLGAMGVYVQRRRLI